MQDNVHQLKLVTVGCGFFSQFHHQAWTRLPVRHLGVCDIDQSRAEVFSESYGIDKVYTDFQLMLDENRPDIVDIVLPPDQHFDHIIQALSSGANVICQKPFTLNLEQAQDIAGISNQSSLQVIVHENFRFQPWYGKIKSIIDSGVMGELYQIRFDLRPGDGQGKEAYLDRQPYFQTMSQFLIKETGVHFIDVFRYLLGEPLSVFADLRQLNPAISGEDAGMFLLEFENDVRAVFDGNRLSDHAADNRRLVMGELRLEAEKGELSLDGDGRLWKRNHGSNQKKLIDFEFNNIGFGGDCVYLLQKHVIESLQKNCEPQNQIHDYLNNLQIQRQIYESNREGKKLALSN